MELDVTWPRVMRIWWSYLWRSLIAIVAAAVLGGIIGAIVGGILGAAGAPLTTIRWVVMPIGFLLGVGISILPLKLILGKDFGEFRLVLMSKS